jgi:acetate kinase
MCTNCGYEVPDTGFSLVHGANLYTKIASVSLTYNVHHNLAEGTEVATLKGKATISGIEHLKREGKVDEISGVHVPTVNHTTVATYHFVRPKRL